MRFPQFLMCLALVCLLGCVPEPPSEETQVVPESDVQISTPDGGQTE
ncbi:MAG: hypothetical protein KDA58_11640 [Planctomycetaceae bacterium]|nr:hypothetical protein [Planctomycetaceae bacterium]